MADGELTRPARLLPNWLALGLIGYGALASILPVWLLLAPRDYLSTFLKIGTIVLLALGIETGQELFQRLGLLGEPGDALALGMRVLPLQ